MKNTNRILFLLCFISGALFAQQDSATLKLNSFVKNVNKFSFLYPQEKVYLHFDNTAYYLGETIWFKSYVVTAENSQLSSLSKVLYVELLTPEGNVLQTQKLKIEDGQAHGGFMLKDSLYSGYYEVRAYTKCMLNFGDDGIFSRVFPIYDKPLNAGVFPNKKMTVRPKSKSLYSARAKSEKLDKINITFFPEGGSLITGLINRVAYKVVDKEGRNIDISGTIYNSKGEEVTSFSTTYRGMGSFSLCPDGQKYTAKINSKIKETTVNLPQSSTSGYTLLVDNLRTQDLWVQINKTLDLPDDTLGITFMCRGKVYAFKTFNVQEGEPTAFDISKSSLPSGITQITVFNSKGQILAERLAFVNHIETAQIKTEINASFAPFSKVNINFQVEDKQGNPIETTFSLAVRDKGTEIQTGYTDNIQTNLLLSSELKGYIENPGYYFEKTDMKHVMALDLLMLTQGWRRYSWKQMAGKEPFEVKHGIEKGLMIEGKVLTDVLKKEKENIEVKMWMLTPYQKGNCTTDKQGNFNLALDDFFGKTDLNLETYERGKRKDYRILLNRVFSPAAKAYDYSELNQNINDTLPTYNQQSIQEKQEQLVVDKTPVETKQQESITTKSHALKEVTVTEKKKWKPEQEGSNQADIVYNVSKELDKMRDTGEREAANILDFIQQQHNQFSYYVNIVDNTPPPLSIPIYKAACNYMGTDVIFVINNLFARITPIDESYTRENYNNYNEYNTIATVNSSVSDLDLSLVESIMISQKNSAAFRYCAECSMNKDYTIIFIYTNKKGSLVDKKGTRKTMFEGFTNIREFYSPNYKTIGIPDEKDFRRTLYWNPDVKTDKDGKSSVSFYNNKTCKNISVTNEGITKEGYIVK
jgi:hypothetical protein